MFFFFKSFDFGVVFTTIPFINIETLRVFSVSINAIDLITIFLFIGAVGKSAQVGLHTWLPDAMEGPTPVSALIHAATMVTAGVFVLIRCSPLFEYSKNALFLISTIGALTALFAGTVGLVQYDIKKVIAYSTCSQLGYMFFACGMSNYSVALFHLFNHGFFKALLFLGAGSVIHAVLDEQDMRKMGGMLKLLPLTYVVILVGSFSLTGFPFLTGFYSKEVILEIALTKFSLNNIFIYWLGVLAAFITSFYSIRLIYLVFFASSNSTTKTINSAHESRSFIFYILSILGFFSIFIGFVFKDIFVGLGTDFWNNSVFQLYTNSDILQAEFLSFHYKLIPLVFSVAGMLASLLVYFLFYNYTNFTITTPFFNKTYWFLVKKWYFDIIYNNLFVFNILKFCYIATFKLVDRGFIEVVGPLSLIRSISRISAVFSSIQTGYIYNYIFLMLIGIIFFMLLLSAATYNLSSDILINTKLLTCLVGVMFLFIIKKQW